MLPRLVLNARVRVTSWLSLPVLPLLQTVFLDWVLFSPPQYCGRDPGPRLSVLGRASATELHPQLQ